MTWIAILDTCIAKITIISVPDDVIGRYGEFNLDWYLSDIGYDVSNIEWMAFDTKPTINFVEK